MKFEVFEAISRQRALDLELSLSKMLGICHSTNLPPAKRFIFYLYCTIVTITLFLIYPTLELIDAFFYCQSITDYTQNLCLSLCHIANVGKVFNLVLRRNKLTEMMNYVLTIEERYVKSEQQKIIVQSNESLIKVAVILFGGVVSLAGLFVAMTSILEPSTIGHGYPFRVFMPEVLPTVLQSIYCALGVDFLAIAIVCNDCIMMTLMQHISAQLEVLGIALQNIRSKNDFVKCVRHHQMILKLSQDTEEFFSTVVLLQFISSSVIFALTIFSVSLRSSVGYQDITLYTYVICLLAELYIYCWSGQNVANSTANVKDLAYFSWNIDADYKLNKQLLFFIVMCQKPIKLTGGGILSLSMETFTALLSKSYSFMTLLRQMYSDGY